MTKNCVVCSSVCCRENPPLDHRFGSFLAILFCCRSFTISTWALGLCPALHSNHPLCCLLIRLAQCLSTSCLYSCLRPTVEECLRRADSRQTSLKMMFAVQRAFPRWRHKSKRPACLHELSVSHGKPWKTEGFFHMNCIISLAVCSAAG